MKPTRCDFPASGQELREPIGAACTSESETKVATAWQGELPSHEFLSRLARDDQAGYEQLRRQMIESFLECAPARHQQRLRGLQFRVDCERQLAHTALGATVRIYGMMWESFHSLNHQWQEVVRAIDTWKNPRASAEENRMVTREKSAQILGFRLRQSGEADCG